MDNRNMATELRKLIADNMVLTEYLKRCIEEFKQIRQDMSWFMDNPDILNKGVTLSKAAMIKVKEKNGDGSFVTDYDTLKKMIQQKKNGQNPV